jgi:hypothetical protein
VRGDYGAARKINVRHDENIAHGVYRCDDVIATSFETRIANQAGKGDESG